LSKKTTAMTLPGDYSRDSHLCEEQAFGVTNALTPLTHVMTLISEWPPTKAPSM